MKTLFFLLVFILSLYGDQESKKYINYLQTLPSKTKKFRFYKLVLPPVKEVDSRLRRLYMQTLQDIQNDTHKERVAKLKRSYRAKDEVDLLKRIKPHPISITLAQAAMESAWGTSRFFVEANNIFGVWSKSTDPNTTIVAGVKRKDGRQIHLKKYPSIKASIEGYYKNLATNQAYKCFREVRYYSDDPFEIVAQLHKYSEKKELYPVALIKIIKHNRLTRFDRHDPLPKLQALYDTEDNETNQTQISSTGP